MEKLLSDNPDDHEPFNGLLFDPNRPNPRVNITSDAYQEDGAMNFLSSNNVPYNRVQTKRGPGRPPRFPRPPESSSNSGAPKPISNIDELCDD